MNNFKSDLREATSFAKPSQISASKLKKEEPSLYMDFSVIEASLENSKEFFPPNSDLLDKLKAQSPRKGDQFKAILIHNANYDALIHRNFLD